MRIVRNIGHVKRRRRLAKWGAVLGGTLLLLSIVLPYRLSSSSIGLAYVVLLGGFLVFNIGMQQVGKWTDAPRKPRNDLVLDRLLADLGEKYALIHYPRLGKHVVEHLVVHPGGVLVLTARELPGVILAKGKRWRRQGFALRRLVGVSGPQLGNPVYETEQGIVAVEGHLEARQLEVEVQGAVVFLHPEVEIDLDEPAVTVLVAHELADYIRSLPADASLRRPEQHALVEALAQGEELEESGARKVRRRPVKRRAA